MKKITIIICDDHPIVRAGLRLLLEAAGDVQVVGEAENGYQAVQESKRLRPDVVLLDLAMPMLNGVEATRQITREIPSTKVLVLSAYSDDQHVHDALAAGATGYLLKETAADGLLRAIRKTRHGIGAFSPQVSARLKRRRACAPKSRRDETGFAILSSRQTQCLQLIAEGYLTREIADLLGISRKTAEKHRQSLMDKLDLHDIVALTRHAVSTGVIATNRAPNLQAMAA